MRHIGITLKLAYEIDKEEDLYVSSCPDLNVSSQGSTEEEAKNNLLEAIQLFFETCIETGTFEKSLKECGFSVSEYSDSYYSNHYMDVPISLVANAQNHTC